MKRLAIATVLAAVALPAAGQSALPGGASSLTESHGTWSVSCRRVEAGKDCAFSQTAANAETGQTVVSIEFGAAAGNRAEGMLLTAFGLRLDAGIRLAIDGQPLGPALPFLTCLQAGCLVPLEFDEVALSALKVGTTLEITGVSMQSGEAVVVPLSLQGFTAAYNRTAELGN